MNCTGYKPSMENDFCVKCGGKRYDHRTVTTRQTRITEAVKYLRDYMNTYDQQREYADYSDRTYIDDVLYGLGVSLSTEYQFAGGYRKFKALLLEHLRRDGDEGSPER